MKRRGLPTGFHWRGIASVIAVSIVLGGCSSVPDAVNPVKWYENTVDLFSGDDENGQTAEQPKPAPGGEKIFPTLGSVPERPQPSTGAERQQIAQGLVADREQRRYAPTVARQSAPANVLGDTPPAPAAPQPTAGAVPALPATPAPVAPVQAAPATPSQPVMARPTPRAGSAPAQIAATPPPAPRVGLEPPPMPKPATAGAMAQPTPVAPRMTRPVAPANAAMPSTGAFDTVVISSTGVEQGGSGARQAAPATAPRFSEQIAMAPSAPSRPLALGGGGSAGSLKVATIQFSTGSAALDSRDRAILRNVVALQAERGGVIRVVGHASSRTANMDATRHRMVNYQVSSDRAQNVAQELIKMGAGANSVVVTAKSDSEPLYFEIMPSGEAGNRRAEIYLDF